MSDPSSVPPSAGQQAREAELSAAAERLAPAIKDWYQVHVLGSGSAERPPEGLVSSVRFSSPDADPDAARSMLGSHTIAIGESAMAQYRMHGDGLPCLVAHELGHAAQRTAAVRAHSTRERRSSSSSARLAPGLRPCPASLSR